MAKELIVFYSRADENYVSGQIRTLKVGNTEIVADEIRKLTGADLFRLEQAKPYSKNYNECIARKIRRQIMNIFEEKYTLTNGVPEEDMDVLKGLEHIKDYGDSSFFPVFGGKM